MAQVDIIGLNEWISEFMIYFQYELQDWHVDTRLRNMRIIYLVVK